jgi:AcrR family transcriptional regulator
MEDHEDDTEPGWRNRVLERSLGKATRRSLDRGAALVTAAGTLLDRSNGDGFTVQEVADEAGQSLRSFYRHFSSKDDLLLAVLEESTLNYVHSIEREASAFDDPLDRLAAALFAANRLPDLNRPGRNVGLSRLHLELAEADPEGVARTREPVALLYRTLIADAEAAGRIGPIDPEVGAYMLMVLTATFAIHRTLGNEFGHRLPSVEEHVAYCLQGLSAKLEPGWEARFTQVTT